MTRSDDVINEDGHDVIAAHTRVVRGMAAALAAIAATGAGVTAAAANVMFTFALDTKAKRSMFNMPHEETPKGIEFDMSEQLEAARWFEEAKQSVTLRSHDGLKLHGWLLDPDLFRPTAASIRDLLPWLCRRARGNGQMGASLCATRFYGPATRAARP